MATYIFSGWVLSLGVSLAGFLPAAGQIQAVQVVDVSEDIREQLDDAYPGWKRVESAAGTATCEGAAGAGLFVTADFDNDMLVDYGMVITTADGSSRLLVILPRVKKAAIHDLGPWTSSAENTHLRVMPMGRKFRPQNTTLDDYFSAQTLAAGTCTGVTTVYLWTGKEFHATPLQK